MTWPFLFQRMIDFGSGQNKIQDKSALLTHLLCVDGIRNSSVAPRHQKREKQTKHSGFRL